MANIKDLVNKLPDPDERGFMSNINKEVVDGVTEGVLNAGPAGIIEVIDMLVDPGKGDDYKAHYLMHCMAINVGKDKEQQRKMLSQTIMKELGNDRTKEVKKYLIRELQVAGGSEAVETLGGFLHDEELCEPAAQALTAISTGALEQFRKALRVSSDKCRLTIEQNIKILQQI